MSWRCPLCMLNRYASAPHELRTDWAKFTKDYFRNRSTLVSVFLLIDASIPAKKIDLEYASWLGENQVLSFHVMFNRKKQRYDYVKWLKWPKLDLQTINYIFIDLLPMLTFVAINSNDLWFPSVSSPSFNCLGPVMGTKYIGNTNIF